MQLPENMEALNDKYSIKNLLFTKAIPNYAIPVPTNGHTVYGCQDCGDKFVLESSYVYHINRKSVKITYMCRHCGQVKIFNNRCNLLAHIRSHSFKTATINVSDLKIEPLPLSHFNMDLLKNNTRDLPSLKSLQTGNQSKTKIVKSMCFECKSDITNTGSIYMDRAKHCMQYTKEVHTCPVCLFSLPTICGLKAHMRVHLKCPPYYCAECGIHLDYKSIFYPYSHDCEGFKMMRATARLKCPIQDCPLFHPNEYKEHLKDNHLKKVFKCPFCFVACFNEIIMERHLRGHKSAGKTLIFYQCEMCPGRLVLQNQIENHLKSHVDNNMYPCWACGTVFKEVHGLIMHHIKKHSSSSNVIKQCLESIQKQTGQTEKKKIYRVVKRCDQCKRSFTYKCKFEQIRTLPNECPYKCTSSLGTVSQTPPTNADKDRIVCPLCKSKISTNWEKVKEHYATHHKTYRCLDPKVVVKKLNIEQYTKNKQRKNIKHGSIKKRIAVKNSQAETNIVQLVRVNESGQYTCCKCGNECENKQEFEIHVVTHRDPCMAYQCMECGQCFVVKPSFSKHMLLEHGVSEIDDYITKKNCYNENALMKYQYYPVANEPLRENQCRICRDQFENASDLEKHFRVHGMAFLMKNNSNKNTSP